MFNVLINLCEQYWGTLRNPISGSEEHWTLFPGLHVHILANLAVGVDAEVKILVSIPLNMLNKVQRSKKGSVYFLASFPQKEDGHPNIKWTNWVTLSLFGLQIAAKNYHTHQAGVHLVLDNLSIFSL
jgi:hypothetical protein